MKSTALNFHYVRLFLIFADMISLLGINASINNFNKVDLILYTIITILCKRVLVFIKVCSYYREHLHREVSIVASYKMVIARVQLNHIHSHNQSCSYIMVICLKW